MRRTLLILSTLLVLAGCGSDPDKGGTGTGATDAGGGGSLFDVTLGDAGTGNDVAADTGSGGVDATGSDGADVGGVAADTTVPDPCSFPANPGSGEPGAACAAPDDCDNAFCIDTPDGKRCAKTCTDCCPNGWKCEQAPGSDTVFVCLPKMGALCSPCVKDDTCLKLATGALCVAYQGDPVGGATRFCGGACGADADCPAGYACKDSAGTKGQGKQCVKATGICGCTDTAATSGAEAACTLTSAAGTCSGVRTCSTTGLGSCNAQNPAAETCNGSDDDCDGQTDEDIAPAACSVDNTFGSCKGTKTCANGGAVCDAATPVAEVCDGQDNDCDGKTDEGCDDDGDGYCPPGIGIVGLPAGCTADIATCNKSGALPAWCPKGVGDCNDAVADGKAVNPGAKELCGNNIDDDCDGATDASSGTGVDAIAPVGCKQLYPDADGDGFGALKGACLCAPTKAYPVTNNTDCDDGDKLVNPKAKEICANGKDDDCNNSENDVDAKDCVAFYVDGDGDGYGAGVSKCLCAPLDAFNATKGGDCDDKKTAVNPKAVEACNTVDDNCNGAIDEANATGCKKWYVDGDKDTYGDSNKSACLCAAAAPYTTLQGGDCDDGKYAVSPGFKEICYDGLDNNCNKQVDEEGGQGCVDYWLDADGDGYGSKTATKKCLCTKGGVKGYTATKGGDCDDSATTGSALHPGAVEVCDGKDNDCDGKTDTSCNVDGDAYCAAGKTVVGKPAVCTKGGGDCNDGDKAIYPGATEVCDGKDNNCASGVDEGCDNDGDGWCDKNMLVLGKPAVCPKGVGDCADTDASRNPGVTEICDNKDNNCTGGTDEGCDDDNDGWCDKNMVVIGKPSTCANGGGDCCDTDSLARPQTGSWFSVKNKCGSWDYNCSNTSEQRYTVKAAPKHICEGFLCTNKAECIASPQGWASTPPACGVSSTWITDYQWNGSLALPLVNTCKTSVTSQRTQQCH